VSNIGKYLTSLVFNAEQRVEDVCEPRAGERYNYFKTLHAIVKVGIKK
jgi:hypothetical protein